MLTDPKHPQHEPMTALYREQAPKDKSSEESFYHMEISPGTQLGIYVSCSSCRKFFGSSSTG